MSNELNFSYFDHESSMQLILIPHSDNEIKELDATEEVIQKVAMRQN